MLTYVLDTGLRTKVLIFSNVNSNRFFLKGPFNASSAVYSTRWQHQHPSPQHYVVT